MSRVSGLQSDVRLQRFCQMDTLFVCRRNANYVWPRWQLSAAGSPAMASSSHLSQTAILQELILPAQDDQKTSGARAKWIRWRALTACLIITGAMLSQGD